MAPSVTLEFGHIRRMTDSRFPHEVAVIMPGQYFISETPMVVYTILGSCISVCIRDILLKIGGMNHFMLAQPTGDPTDDHWGTSARYGSYAMEVLLNELYKRGANKNRLEVKIFGGGKIYQGPNDVGARNLAWVLEYLGREGLQPIKGDVGNTCPRKVYFFTDSGRVLLKRLDSVQGQDVVKDEQAYQSTITAAPISGEVTLF